MAKVFINSEYLDYVGGIASKRKVSLTTALHQIISEHKTFKSNICTVTNNSIK